MKSATNQLLGSCRSEKAISFKITKNELWVSAGSSSNLKTLKLNASCDRVGPKRLSMKHFKTCRMMCVSIICAKTVGCKICKVAADWPVANDSRRSRNFRQHASLYLFWRDDKEIGTNYLWNGTIAVALHRMRDADAAFGPVVLLHF